VFGWCLEIDLHAASFFGLKIDVSVVCC
jgi:hypothetical protein